MEGPSARFTCCLHVKGDRRANRSLNSMFVALACMRNCALTSFSASGIALALPLPQQRLSVSSSSTRRFEKNKWNNRQRARHEVQVYVGIYVKLHDEIVMPPESTTWRARTEDVSVKLRDVLKRSAVESAGLRNLRFSTESLSAPKPKLKSFPPHPGP